ncbi:hypothetical protein Hdeb2414_s0142g00811851 [Helianthus debilis subsp. tardiflorus]
MMTLGDKSVKYLFSQFPAVIYKVGGETRNWLCNENHQLLFFLLETNGICLL